MMSRQLVVTVHLRTAQLHVATECLLQLDCRAGIVAGARHIEHAVFVSFELRSASVTHIDQLCAEAGGTDLPVGAMVPKEEIKEANAKAEAEGAEPAKGDRHEGRSDDQGWVMIKWDLRPAVKVPLKSGDQS